MKNLKRKIRYSLYALLAIVLYVLFMPVTIIQAIVFVLVDIVTDRDMFRGYSPISAIVSENVMKYVC